MPGSGNVVYIKFGDQVKPYLSDGGLSLATDLAVILKSLFGENLFTNEEPQVLPSQSSREAFFVPLSVGYQQGPWKRRRQFRIVPLTKPLAAIDSPQLAGIGDADPTPVFEIVEI